MKDGKKLKLSKKVYNIYAQYEVWSSKIYF